MEAISCLFHLLRVIAVEVVREQGQHGPLHTPVSFLDRIQPVLIVLKKLHELSLHGAHLVLHVVLLLTEPSDFLILCDVRLPEVVADFESDRDCGGDGDDSTTHT